MESEVAAQIVAQSQKIAQGQEQTTKYFITTSRRNCLRRLHLSGCFVKPDRCGEVAFVDQVSTDDFDSVCQACKKKMLAECGRDTGDQSSSTASSSSTGSEADDLNVPM